jgi:hypothetical protein
MMMFPSAAGTFAHMSQRNGMLEDTHSELNAFCLLFAYPSRGHEVFARQLACIGAGLSPRARAATSQAPRLVPPVATPTAH